MKPRVFVSCLAVAMILATIAAVKYFGGGTSTTPQPPKPPILDRSAKMPLETEPAKLSLGKHTPCEEPLTATVTLTNKSDAPVAVKRITATCACTSATIEGDRTLKPGEKRTMEVRVDLTGSGGKSQRVDLIGESAIVGSVRVDYEIESPVRPEHEAVDVGPAAPRAEVKVVAVDGRKIALKGMTPDIGTILTRPDGTQVAELDMARADAYANTEEGKMYAGFRRDADGTWTGLYVLIETDYPACPNASVLLRRER